MGLPLRIIAVLSVTSLLAMAAAGCGSRADGSGDQPPTHPPTPIVEATVAPAGGGDAASGTACAAGEFRLGTWEQPGAASPGRVTGLAASGDAACAQLRISFDGPAPGVKVWRPSEGNHTYVTLLADFVDIEPVGPVESDLLLPELALLSTAILTSDQGGLTVVAIHDDHTDVAAQAQVTGAHVDVYFRTAQAGDARVDDTWPGGPHHLELLGETDQGLLITYTSYDGEWVITQGYAKAPESHVVVRVQVSGLGVACDQTPTTAGPPYLYSWFHDACRVPMPHDYLIQVGWHSPAGPLDDVWQWYDVSDS